MQKQKIKELALKYREQIMYLVFGGLTTLVNMAAFWFFDEQLGLSEKLSVAVPTALAQVIAVTFAYITNKLFVFKSHQPNAKALLREIGSFFGCRAISFFLDVGIMWLTVDKLGWHKMLMKFVSNVIIVIVNYVASKLLIFNKDGKGGDAAQ